MRLFSYVIGVLLGMAIIGALVTGNGFMVGMGLCSSVIWGWVNAISE